MRPSSRASFVSAPLAGLHATSQHRQSCNRFATHGRLRHRPAAIVSSSPLSTEASRHSCRRRCPRASVLRSMVEVYWGYLPRPFKGWRTVSIAPAAKAFPCFFGRHAACCGSPATGNGLLASSAAPAIRAIPPTRRNPHRYHHRDSAIISGVAGGVLLPARVRPE